MKQLEPRRRDVYALIAVIAIGLGLASRGFPHYMPSMFGKYPGDCLWAVVVFLILAIFAPSRSTQQITLIAGMVCVLVEVLKLVPSDLLKSVRYTTIGHLILGHVFMWQNLIAYLVGVMIGACMDVIAWRSKDG